MFNTSVNHPNTQSKRLPKWHVLVDFDGTIAPDDPTDRLLECYADPAWRDVEAAWQCGEISSRECLERQVALLRVTPEALDAQIRTVRLDPSFPAFIELCRRRNAHVTIVSDGFDRVVNGALRRARLSVPSFSNKLEWQGDDRWRLAFPHSQSDCRVRGGNCKCSHGHWGMGRPHVVIGDGRSDFCMSMRADYTIAKGSLAEHCRARGLTHASFANFKEVIVHISAWFASPETRIPHIAEDVRPPATRSAVPQASFR